MRLYYTICNGDTGFVYRNLDLSTYFVPDFLFADHRARKSIDSISPKSDIYFYHDSLFEYNTETKELISLNPGKRNLFARLHTIKQLNNYLPMLPYSAQIIKYQGHYCFIYNYQLIKTKQLNFLDSSPFLIVTDSLKFIKLGQYPSYLHKEKTRLTETFFLVDSISNIYYFHSGYDSVYKINTEGTILARGVLHDSPVREKFKPSKDGDLAYIRKYEAGNEKNIALSLMQNKYLVVLKRLAEPDLLKPKKYKYFIFDKALNKLFADTVRHTITPYVLSTANGFLLFSENFKETYNYEVH